LSEVVLYGYRVSEVITVKLPPVDPSFKLLKFNKSMGGSRPVMRVSLGIHQINYANPVPDTTNQENALNGVMKRIATKMPEIDQELHEEFKTFSYNFIRDELRSCKISPSDDYSFETWIANTPYTETRRKELCRVQNDRDELETRDYFLKCFVKDESYTEFKYPRGIYSRADRFKTKFGPIMKIIGDRLFALPYFIKKIPVSCRPPHIKELYSDPLLKIATNDFTAFEATFVVENMEIELDFLSFCLSDLPCHDDMMKDLKTIKQGMNRMQFKHFVVMLLAKRYSGEMDTSLSNSVFNLILIMFLLYKSSEDYKKLTPKIEGDDSIIPYYGELDTTIVKRLGANAKFEFFDEISHASFCGLVFDVDMLDIITNIVPAILDFGWTTREYTNSSARVKLTLLRCKSLSLLHSYPGCPILHSLACLGLRVTRSVDMRADRNKTIKHRFDGKSIDSHHRIKHLDIMKYEYEQQGKDKLIEMINRPINMKTRLLVEKLYKITVEQQLEMEKYLDSITTVGPLDIPFIGDFCNPDQMKMWDMYSSVRGTEGL
jgi:hypothetical protein